ncbi:hypothetical protein LCY76_16550 [Fictibacillus sp. KIGAM418]|uniref:Uncharacterized protein n=1 Tax=Fictibacillus marinisediminis TaxID=2878389 RepID=A0A9X1XCI8_9BACL|nr:hypothetical protein [Fictibacillus marinisediminis]
MQEVLNSPEWNFLQKFVLQHYEILKIIKKREGSNGIASISVPEIARILMVSQTQATKYISRLKENGYVEKVDRGMYRVLKFESPELPVFNHIFQVVADIINRQPEEPEPLKVQANRLSLSVKELQTALGYISYLNSLSK